MHVYKRNDSGLWWVKFKHNGVTVRKSTGCTDPKQAGIKAGQIRYEHTQKRPRASSEHSGVTLAVLEELDTQRAKDKGYSNEVATLTNRWRNLHRHLGGETRDAMTLTPADFETYEGARRAETYHGESIKGQTIRRELQALKRGLRKAKRDKLIGALPFDFEDLEDIESDTPRERQEGKPRSDKQIKSVLKALSKKAKRVGYDKMLRFLQLTGLRLEEFRRFQPQWIRPAPRGSKAAALLFIPAEAAKTPDPRVLPLSKEALEIGKKWGAHFARHKFNHALELACAEDRANLWPPLTPRDLRATYLTNVARLDVTAAQKLAGHRNIATTGRYVDLASELAVETGAAMLAGGTARGHGRSARSRKAQ